MRPQGSAIFRPVKTISRQLTQTVALGGIFFDRPFINTASRSPQPPVHPQHDNFRPKSSLIRVAPRSLGQQKPFTIYHKAIERSIQR
jgi:hypothetical protein